MILNMNCVQPAWSVSNSKCPDTAQLLLHLCGNWIQTVTIWQPRNQPQWLSEASAAAVGRTGRHLLNAANWRKLYEKIPRENSDCKFHMCLRAVKTKHYSQRVTTVGTVGYNTASYW